jgi:hypothetical protein
VPGFGVRAAHRPSATTAAGVVVDDTSVHVTRRVRTPVPQLTEHTPYTATLHTYGYATATGADAADDTRTTPTTPGNDASTTMRTVTPGSSVHVPGTFHTSSCDDDADVAALPTAGAGSDSAPPVTTDTPADGRVTNANTVIEAPPKPVALHATVHGRPANSRDGGVGADTCGSHTRTRSTYDKPSRSTRSSKSYTPGARATTVVVADVGDVSTALDAEPPTAAHVTGGPAVLVPGRERLPSSVVVTATEPSTTEDDESKGSTRALVAATATAPGDTDTDGVTVGVDDGVAVAVGDADTDAVAESDGDDV